MAGLPKSNLPQTMKPPPPHLTKEMQFVWDGWIKMNDREITRESAIKGTHTDLALLFLSQRRGISLEATELWFNSEIRNWASELLSNKQVFRASHILTNVKLDPTREIEKIFINTPKKELRDFLGNHLNKIGDIDDDSNRIWELVKIAEDINFNFNKDEITINFIKEQDFEWKNNIAAKILLLSKEKSLMPLVSSEFLWENAVLLQDSDFLLKWIDVQYANLNDLDIEEDLHDFLKTLSISNEMLQYLFYDDDVNEAIRCLLCDKLAQYGIFSSQEKTDLRKIVKRLNRVKSLHLLNDIFTSPNTNISREEFNELIKTFCVKNENYVTLDICTKDYDITSKSTSDVLNLIKSHREVATNINDTQALLNNYLLSTKHIKLNKNVRLDSIIKIFFILLDNKCNLYTALSDPTQVTFAIDPETMLKSLDVLHNVYNKLTKSSFDDQLSVYDLLNKHSSLNPKKLFRYRFSQNHELPHFNLEALTNKYGIQITINYLYYLQQNRPSKAIELFIKDDATIENKVVSLAVKNFCQKDVVSSCIAFLEMIGKSSERLRIEVYAADIIHQFNDMKEQDVIELILNRNKLDVLKLFETSLSKNDVMEITTALESYDLLAKYAEYNQLPPPNNLPKIFAENDLWLPFLIILQKYNFKQEQACKLVQNFKDKKLLEHIQHAIIHNVHYDQNNDLMRERDSRNYLVSRIGVRMTEDKLMTSSYNSQSSYGSTSSSGLSDLFEIELCDMKNIDLLQLLIKCHNSGDPPKALLHCCVYYKYPLFAILATSYEPDSVITNWLTWLSVMCNVGNISCEGMALVGNDITEFLKTVLQNGYYKTLQQSFHIFLSESPLNIFMSMLGDCISLNFKIDTLRQKLDRFHKLLLFKRSNSFISEIDHEMTYFDNKVWIESTALVLLAGALQSNFKTTYNKLQFLKTLNELDLKKYFFTDLPDFTNMVTVIEYLFDHRISVHLDFFKLCSVGGYKVEIINCVNTLLKKELFEDALSVAGIVGLAADTVLAEKWKRKFMAGDNDDFWLNCDSELRTYKIIPMNAVIFYTNFTLSNDEDKYRMLKLAYDWACEYNLPNENSLEYKMWKVYLKLDDTYVYEARKYEKELLLYSDIKQALNKLIVDDNMELNDRGRERLDAVINQLLKTGNVLQAFKLVKLFNHTNQNVDIIRLCFKLAEGLTLPLQLTAQERLLARKGSNYRSFSHRMKTLRSTRLSSLSSVSRSPGTLSVGTVLEMETETTDTVVLIENLIDGLTSGEELAQNVLMLYRISVNIDKKYGVVFQNDDPEELLLEALRNDCKCKLEVVHDFISVYHWNKEKIATFLCEQIISAITQSTESNQTSFELWDVNLDSDIHIILQLLPDTCSILGNKFYKIASTMFKEQTSAEDYPNISTIIQITELLIRSHDCYTTDCNMEGISIILKKCQTMFNLLLTLKNWNLIIRLLTGIGRYNELNYVLHILQENDQFENLLRRGKSTHKNNGLKVALLEYLRRYCPENRDLYKMVALHYTLYSEVAQLWENEALGIIEKLVAISKLEMQNRKLNPDTCLFVELTNTAGTKFCLQKSMDLFADAAEYHLQGDKLARSMNAARQAELIALQMSLLKGSTATCILSLTNTQINTLLENQLNFQQALILTEAYNHQTDWATVLYEQYIINNRITYLAYFHSVFQITDTLVQDISRRFLLANINTENSINNMKSVIKMLTSVHTKYRVASELGFTDLVEDLLNGDRLMYLKDTVWKKGYRG